MRLVIVEAENCPKLSRLPPRREGGGRGSGRAPEAPRTRKVSDPLVLSSASAIGRAPPNRRAGRARYPCLASCHSQLVSYVALAVALVLIRAALVTCRRLLQAEVACVGFPTEPRERWLMRDSQDPGTGTPLVISFARGWRRIKCPKSLLLLSLTLGASLSSCAPRQPPEVIVVTADENGSMVMLAPGSTLVVRLRSNATSNYRWAPRQVPRQLRLLRITEHEAPATGSTPAENTIIQSLEFHVHGRGEGALVLEYRPVSRTAAGAVETFKLQTRVTRYF